MQLSSSTVRVLVTIPQRDSLRNCESRKALPPSLPPSLERAFEKEKIALGVIAKPWETAETSERASEPGRGRLLSLLNLSKMRKGTKGQIPKAPSAVRGVSSRRLGGQVTHYLNILHCIVTLA